MAEIKQQQSHIRQLKLFYFVFIGAGGFLLPFINLFFERKGLSGTQIGLLGTIAAITGLIAAPFIGQFSDRSKNPRQLLQIIMVISAFVYLIISQQSAFLPIALLTVFATAADSGIGPLSTMLAFDTGIEGQENRFGSVRVWGSLGWAVVVLLAGYLIENLGLFTSFAGYAVMIIISAGVLFFLNSGKPKQVPENPLSRGKLIKTLLADRSLVGLAISLVLLWTARSGIWLFQPLFLDQLGAGEGLIGVTSMVGSIIELPSMFLADRIAQRRGSHQLLRITYLLYAFTASLVLISPTIPTIIASEAIGGISYSFLLVSSVMFINERSPNGQTTTVLALYSVTLHGLTSMFSSPLGGMVFDRFGPYWLYAISLAGCFAAWVVLSRMAAGKRSSISA